MKTTFSNASASNQSSAPTNSACWPGPHRVVAAEPRHLLADALVDVALLLEQLLQLLALLLQVLRSQPQALRFALVAFLLLPLVGLQ